MARKKTLRKKKRSPAQRANDKRLGAMAKKRAAKRNPARKRRTKKKRATKKAPSFFRIVKAKGYDVRYFNVTSDGRPRWFLTPGDGYRFETKEHARINAKHLAINYPPPDGWKIAVVPNSMQVPTIAKRVGGVSNAKT